MALMLASATSDLTITEGVTVNYAGESALNSGEADLTLNGSVNVLYGGILSSGGTVTFGTGSSGASFSEKNSGMLLDRHNSCFADSSRSSIPPVNRYFFSFQTNGNTLNLGFIEIGVQNELDLTNVVTDNESGLYLIGNSEITKTGALVFKQIVNRGYTLTLNSVIDNLTAESIYIPNLYDSNAPNYLESTGKFLAQGVDVTLRKQIYLQKGTIEMGGGTLTLEQGGYLQGDGVLDVSNSVLSLSGPFHKYDNGTLTTSASTLRLNANVKFEPKSAVTFDTYEPNGWGLVLIDNSSNLTIGGNVSLQPSAESLTSGFVDHYSTSSEEVMDNNSHVIGIETNQASLTISGTVTLQDNATINSDSGSVSLGNLDLENGNIDVNGGTFNLAGGGVGANGLIEVGEQGNLSLQGNLTVAGTLDLNDGATINLADNATANLSGGNLELAGSHSLDGITTDNNTTLQINTSGGISRTDNGTSTVGNLVLSQGSSSGVSFVVDNMSLTVGGTAQFGGDNITLNSANLDFQGTPSFDNSSSLSVISGGGLILQSGVTINDSSLDFTSSTFKPSGTVSLTGSSHFTFDSGSSVMLEGDSTLSQSGSVTWPSPDLNGNALTLNVDNMTIDGALSIGTGESLSGGSSNLYLHDNLTIDNGGALSSDNGSVTISSGLALNNGGTLSSGSGDVEISGAITLDGELRQGGGMLNLIGGGTVGSTGRLDVSHSRLQLGSALSFAGTLVVNSGTYWSGLGGTVDLSAGTLESSGGTLSLDKFTTGANTAFKLSGNTEITSSDNMTFGALDSWWQQAHSWYRKCGTDSSEHADDG